MTKQEPFTAVKASCCANYANEKQLVSGQVLLAEDARLVSGYCTSSSAVHSNYTVGTNGPACNSCLWGGRRGPSEVKQQQSHSVIMSSGSGERPH